MQPRRKALPCPRLGPLPPALSLRFRSWGAPVEGTAMPGRGLGLLWEGAAAVAVAVGQVELAAEPLPRLHPYLRCELGPTFSPFP